MPAVGASEGVGQREEIADVDVGRAVPESIA